MDAGQCNDDGEDDSEAIAEVALQVGWDQLGVSQLWKEKYLS